MLQMTCSLIQDGEDFEFIRKDSQGVIQVETISHFGQDSVVRQKTDYGVGIAHHASLLVGCVR